MKIYKSIILGGMLAYIVGVVLLGNYLKNDFCTRAVVCADEREEGDFRGFVSNGVYPSVANLNKIQYWGSYGANGNETTGYYISPWYDTKGEVILYLSGYFGQSDMLFYLETTDNDKIYCN